MSAVAIHDEAPVRVDSGTRLALERTYLAHERTLMAWVRTALALISFGFTIAKFFQFLREQQGQQATLLGSRTVGILMIAIGLVALALAGMQQRQAMKVLREQCPDLPRSVAVVVALLIAVLGILALVGILLR
jgi:putative membrane protein